MVIASGSLRPGHVPAASRGPGGQQSRRAVHAAVGAAAAACGATAAWSWHQRRGKTLSVHREPEDALRWAGLW